MFVYVYELCLNTNNFGCQNICQRKIPFKSGDLFIQQTLCSWARIFVIDQHSAVFADRARNYPLTVYSIFGRCCPVRRTLHFNWAYFSAVFRIFVVSNICQSITITALVHQYSIVQMSVSSSDSDNKLNIMNVCQLLFCTFARNVASFLLRWPAARTENIRCHKIDNKVFDLWLFFSFPFFSPMR